MGVRIESGDPKFLLIHYEGEVSHGDVDQVDDRIDAYLAKRQPFVIVVDTAGSAPPVPAVRSRLSSMMTKDSDKKKPYLLGCAMVLTSSLMRGVLTALKWLSPPPIPVETFGTREAAETWARAQLQKTAA